MMIGHKMMIERISFCSIFLLSFLVIGSISLEDSGSWETPIVPSTDSSLSPSTIWNSLELTSSDNFTQPFTGPKCSNLDKCLTALRGRKVDSERERNCACDQQCAVYGDCCNDSPWLEGSVTPFNRSFTCVDIPSLGGFYMITQCPDKLQNSDLREKCERGSLESDPMASLPVTDINKQLTYRNIFCAMCHSDSKNKVFWNANLACSNLNKNEHTLTEDEIRSNLVFDFQLNKWVVNYTSPNGSQVIKECSISPVFPTSAESSIRSCKPGLIESCPSSWSDETVANECASYQASRFTDRVGYRNTACALCNGVNATSLKCSPILTRALDSGADGVIGRASHPHLGSPFYSGIISFSLLLDMNEGSKGNSTVGKTNPCPESDQKWDLFFQSCRSLVCGFKNYRLINGRCLRENEPESKIFGNKPVNQNSTKSLNSLFPEESKHNVRSITTQYYDFQECPMIILTRNEIKFLEIEKQELKAKSESSIIYVPRYNKTFNSTNYLMVKDSIYICSDFLDYEISLNKFSQQMGLVTLIGLGISIGSLVLHIIAFTLVSDVRNLSGQNLVCLSVSLILAYSSFICMQVLTIRESTLLCRITGATVLYFFLASMAWMNVIAWDVCRTLRLATVELRVASGKQRGRFFLYSLYAWTISGLFTGAALLADFLPSDMVPETIKPGFGLSGHCWFQRRSALILFFGSPVALIMSINLIMFILSTFMIGSTTRGTASFTQITTARTNYKLYLKLWLLMGLTWFVGFPASFLESLTLWYIFIILNTLQGLFIFIAFSCKRKILRTIKSKLSSLTSSSVGGSYSVATLSQNNSKLSSESDLTMRTSCHSYHQPNHQQQKSHHFYPHHPPTHAYLQSNHYNINNYERKMSNRH